MDNLDIVTGEKRLTINNDPARVIVFNPEDIGFAEKYYALLQEFKAKEAGYVARANAIDANTEKDADGIDKNAPDKMAFVREVCEFTRAEIDKVFGAGTSQAAFGNANTLNMLGQFFQGVTPFIQKARSAKVEQYAPPASVKRHKRSVMK